MMASNKISLYQEKNKGVTYFYMKINNLSVRIYVTHITHHCH